jgi:hypothetical protein
MEFWRHGRKGLGHMDRAILTHVESLSGSKAQENLPRYRKRETANHEYVFACRLKRAPHLWLVIHDEYFGLMPEAQFDLEYIASNECSREQRNMYAEA